MEESRREEAENTERTDRTEGTEKETAPENEKPLMFLLSLGDCEPIIYTIAIALNKKCEKMHIKDDTFKRMVEEANIALWPVFQKFNEEMLGNSTEDTDEGKPIQT